jgi:hypothetical protein
MWRLALVFEVPHGEERQREREIEREREREREREERDAHTQRENRQHTAVAVVGVAGVDGDTVAAAAGGLKVGNARAPGIPTTAQ